MGWGAKVCRVHAPVSGALGPGDEDLIDLAAGLVLIAEDGDVPQRGASGIEARRIDDHAHSSVGIQVREHPMGRSVAADLRRHACSEPLHLEVAPRRHELRDEEREEAYGEGEAHGGHNEAAEGHAC